MEVSFKTAAGYRKHSCSIIRVMITLAEIVHNADQMIFKVRVGFHSNGGKNSETKSNIFHILYKCD